MGIEPTMSSTLVPPSVSSPPAALRSSGPVTGWASHSDTADSRVSLAIDAPDASSTSASATTSWEERPICSA